MQQLRTVHCRVLKICILFQITSKPPWRQHDRSRPSRQTWSERAYFVVSLSRPRWSPSWTVTASAPRAGWSRSWTGLGATTPTCPMIDVIDDDTLETRGGVNVGGFDWNLQSVVLLWGSLKSIREKSSNVYLWSSKKQECRVSHKSFCSVKRIYIHTICMTFLWWSCQKIKVWSLKSHICMSSS